MFFRSRLKYSHFYVDFTPKIFLYSILNYIDREVGLEQLQAIKHDMIHKTLFASNRWLMLFFVLASFFI